MTDVPSKIRESVAAAKYDAADRLKKEMEDEVKRHKATMQKLDNEMLSILNRTRRKFES